MPRRALRPRPVPSLGLEVVVPAWDQWPMTQAFLESWVAAVRPGTTGLTVVDNGSTDATPAGLKAWGRRLAFRVIRNRRNLGCAPAWNQGVRAALKRGAAWVGVLNNDLLLGPGLFERLLRRAQERGWDAVSPATREGALDYDLQAYAAAYTTRCHSRDEAGWHGWCFLVRRGVFSKVGLFDEAYKLGVGEDEDFFRRLKAAGLSAGVTGSAFVHHFGSPSLGALRRTQGRGFEEKNLARLRGRWGAPARRGPMDKLASALSRAGQRLRWGHLLKE